MRSEGGKEEEWWSKFESPRAKRGRKICAGDAGTRMYTLLAIILTFILAVYIHMHSKNHDVTVYENYLGTTSISIMHKQ